ncbi:MAG: uracil-xanthine permease [Clostridia bacterium]|nr:uracil-xanthine permease [Clostridia bacterium]
MKLIYNVQDKPKAGQIVVFAFQQLLAIMAATIAVPGVVNQVTGSHMTASAAMFGAGIGTIVYLLFTKFKSPVFLGSSFAFLGSMFSAFAGAIAMGDENLGYFGLIIGAAFAGLVYVVLSIIVKFAGVNWINKIMPAVVIGPTVAIIGLSLAGNAVGDAVKGGVADASGNAVANPYVAFICAFVTMVVVVVCSTYGKKMAKLIPFIIGILAGYAMAVYFTVIGMITNTPSLQIVDFSPFTNLVAGGVGVQTFISLPQFTFVNAIQGLKSVNPAYIATIAVGFIPVAFVVFAEHIADHKNLSSIIEKDLLVEPGLSRTLLGDGIGSFAGAVFGGCPNTTYGESIGCVAITGNASIVTILCAAILAIVVSFLSPVMAFLNSVPPCVMGGVCITLYGFIAVSGLKMIQKSDLNDNANLFTVSVILICGVGGLSFTFGDITITTVASALILGIITNLMLKKGRKKEEAAVETKVDEITVDEETADEVKAEEKAD